MKRVLAIALSLMIAAPAIADVTVPAGTPKATSGLNFDRGSQYKVGSIYLGDGSANTMRVLAPDLADDLTIFKLPSTNGTTGQALVGDGAGALSYGDVLTPTNTATVTNKDIDGGTASNSLRITVPKNTKSNLDGLTRKEATVVYASDEDKLYVDNGASLSAVGSGSGQGVENFIANGRAEDSTITGISTYDDGASATPVDCTGGSPSAVSAASRNTSSPMSELADYLLSKSAANGQGQGWAFTVTLPANNPAATAGWQATFDAMIRTSAAYVSSDMGVYVYDVTNATTPVLITNIAASTQSYTGPPWSFGTSGTSASYRICFHIQTTSALAYDLHADNLYAGIEKNGPSPTTPWITSSWTPSTSWVSNTTTAGSYTVDGNKLSGSGFIRTSGAPTSTALAITLPNGWTVDETALGIGAELMYLGDAYIADSSTSERYEGKISYTQADSTLLRVRQLAQSANTVTTIDRASTTVTQASPFTFASGDYIAFDFKNIPITQLANPSYQTNAGNCEYAYTTEAWDAAGSTTAFGAGGTLMGGALSTARAKTVTFRNPVKVYDIQMSRDGIAWQSAIGANLSTGIVIPSLSTTGTSGTSGGVYKSSPSTYQVTATFFRYMSIANDDSPTADWPSTDYWRIENCPTASGSITFAMARDGHAGLVEPYSADSLVHGSSYSATVASLEDFSAVTTPATVSSYARIGPIVFVTGSTSITNADSTRHRASISVPVGSATAANHSGVCAFRNGVSTDTLRSVGGTIADGGDGSAHCAIWPPATSGAGILSWSFSYEIE